MEGSDVKVESPNVKYHDDYIEAVYNYTTTRVRKDGNALIAQPLSTEYTFQTQTKLPRLGLMLVGMGGNNGSTLIASILANKHAMQWHTKTGKMQANYYGSITQSSTVYLGSTDSGEEVFIPMQQLLPMVHPNDLIIDGWDISSANMAEAMERAQVLDYNLQEQLRPYLTGIRPRPSIYIPDFIAANQEDRANNVLTGTKQMMLEQVRRDIRDFKESSGVDKIIVLWTANTERFSDVQAGLNDTSETLLNSIRNNESEVSPSTLFAVASILEGCTYINGSPQNTFVPGVIELAEKKKVFIGGDDFKSGQTKVKSVLVDFLVSAGIKPVSVVSYNHLGNNDGKNLSAPKTFRSKEISKSNVIDDMVKANRLLYKENEHPDHMVVIKYVPYVGDSKRAMDEYTSEIMMGGHNTMVIHNTCEDSLLATPLMIDLVVLAELCQRIKFKVGADQSYQGFNSVLSILSYLCKAPLVPNNTPLVNSLFRQRACIENIFRACIGLSPLNHMMLEYKHQNINLSQNNGLISVFSKKEAIDSKNVIKTSNGVQGSSDSEGEK